MTKLVYYNIAIMSLTFTEFAFGTRGTEVHKTEAERAREHFPHLTITDPMMHFLLEDVDLEFSDALTMIEATHEFGAEGFNGFRKGVVAGKIIAGTASPKVNEYGFIPFEFSVDDQHGSKRGFAFGLASTACLDVVVDLERLYYAPKEAEVCAYHDDTFLILLAQKMHEAPLGSVLTTSGQYEKFTPFEEPLV